MVGESQVDQLLDEWEEKRDLNPRLSLDQFIKDRLAGAGSELIEAFRHQAEELASMDGQMEQVAGPLLTASQIPKFGSDDLRLSALQPGLEPIPGYKLLVRLGSGGFGEVWKAESPGGFYVALKFVQIGGRVGEAEERSLEVIKDVRHPHLLSVFGAWRIGDLLIIATELADRTLLDRLHEAQKEGHEGIPRDELLVYFAEAAKGIDALNDPGSSGRVRIQHRDIKPQNLLLSGGSVKVGDFGLARSIQYGVTGHTGSLTFAYAAPECFDGTTSNRSDQYSLAITYCHLRGGRLPFDGTQVEVMEGHRKKQPDLSMLSAEERPAVAKALAKRPKDRWNSCSEFVQALSSSDSQPNAVPNSSLIVIFQRQLAEMPKKWAIGVTAVAVLLLICLSNVLFPGRPRNAGDKPQVGSNEASITYSNDDDATTKPLTLAVMDFDNHSRDPNLDGFRLGFRDMLVTDLSRISAIKILERGRLKDLLEEHELAKSPFIDHRATVRLGKGLSANRILTGSYVIAGDDIRVDVRLVSVETGEVLLADAVAGKKSNIFPLQQALSEKVLSGLKVTSTEEERQALAAPLTNKYEAFRLFSEARLAQNQGDRTEAIKRFRAALAEDPTFELAADELDRLETEALFRLTESQKQKARAAGEAGERLREHWIRHQVTVEKNQRDAAYFASVIILSAHAGLYGDNRQERQLLLTFWKHFSESVPPDRFVEIAKDIREIIVREGEFFQTNVDSGHYGILIAGKTPHNYYLKAELRQEFSWPQWSRMWPFPEDLRGGFDTLSNLGKLNAEWFEKNLPRYPHEYLKSVMRDVWNAKREDQLRYMECLETYLSIASYYGRVAEKSAPIAKELRSIQSTLLTHLDGLALHQTRSDFIEDAIPVLELIAKTPADTEQRELADKLLVRFVQQMRINKGISADMTSPEAGPVKFYDHPIDGTPLLLVWHVGELLHVDSAQFSIESHVRESLGDVIRALPANTQFNFLWAGCVDEKKAEPLFEQPHAADAPAKQKGQAWLGQKAPGSIKETQSLGTVVETLVRDWDERGLVIVVALNGDASIPQSTVDFLLRLKSRPRFLVVATKKHRQLAKLAAASNGWAILLKTEGDLPGIKNVVAESWDVANEKPKPTTSIIEPVQPTDLTIEDFGLDARIKNQDIRQHLQTAIERHLSTLDPQQASNTRYFASLALLAQIAGRIGQRPLEDALTRKWWAEIEPLADTAAALTYERNRQQSRGRPDVIQPLLFELKDTLRDESKKLWFQAGINGLTDLPKAMRAPKSEPYIWASPISWLSGMTEYKEEMGYPLNARLLNYHIRAGAEFNTEFVNLDLASKMRSLVEYRGGVQSDRHGTAAQIAEVSLQLLDSIPIVDRDRQKWLIDSAESIRKSQQEILNESKNPRDLVAASEYAPRRPWRGVERSPLAFPLLGRTLNADSLVIVCDMSVSSARDRSTALQGLSLAISECGDGIQLQLILAGREVKAWPKSDGMAVLDSDARTRLAGWIKEQDQGGPDTSSFTRGNLAKAITTASVTRDRDEKPPMAIAVICQGAELEKLDPAELVVEIPIHTFAIPRLGSSGWNGQKKQIEKMRVLAEKSGGQFTVVSDDWIWLYLAPP